MKLKIRKGHVYIPNNFDMHFLLSALEKRGIITVTHSVNVMPRATFTGSQVKLTGLLKTAKAETFPVGRTTKTMISIPVIWHNQCRLLKIASVDSFDSEAVCKIN